MPDAAAGPVPATSPGPAGNAPEAGRCAGSGDVHAVRPGLAGPRAACGAGAITLRVPGRFDPHGQQACAACVRG